MLTKLLSSVVLVVLSNVSVALEHNADIGEMMVASSQLVHCWENECEDVVSGGVYGHDYVLPNGYTIMIPTDSFTEEEMILYREKVLLYWKTYQEEVKHNESN